MEEICVLQYLCKKYCTFLSFYKKSGSKKLVWLVISISCVNNYMSNYWNTSCINNYMKWLTWHLACWDCTCPSQTVEEWRWVQSGSRWWWWWSGWREVWTGGTACPESPSWTYSTRLWCFSFIKNRIFLLQGLFY